MTPRKPWTCADTAMLRKLAAKGLAMHRIGERMGRSASSVKRWAKREGIHVSQPARCRRTSLTTRPRSGLGLNELLGGDATKLEKDDASCKLRGQR